MNIDQVVKPENINKIVIETYLFNIFLKINNYDLV